VLSPQEQNVAKTGHNSSFVNSIKLEDTAEVASSVAILLKPNASSLTISIDTVASNLGLEASRAAGVESNLATSISNERTRAENSEATLQSSINTLRTDLSSLTTEQASDIATELARAQAAESALSTRCDTLQQQQTVHSGQIANLYTYFYNSNPTVVPTR
jgi:septal ring factor EnvC (AmiA/AmiB activator)